MNVKTFLEGFNSKSAVNTDSDLNVRLKGKRKLLPFNDVAEVISSFDIYNEEREACNKIRLTCQVNPVCSNVLFNRVTEIVRDEGSSAVTFVNYGITPNESNVFNEVVYKPKEMSFWSGGTMAYCQIDSRLDYKDPNNSIDATDRQQVNDNDLKNTSREYPGHPANAIRDTQLSRITNDGNSFIYHCGLDILNNHLIRSNTFKTVCKLYENTKYDADKYTAFNTIADFMRDVKGEKVIEKLCFPVSAGVENNVKFIPLHLYLYEDILTFEQAIDKRLIEKYNGWVGFNNKSKIKTYDNFQDSEDLKIERPLMYMQGGDFVDMYPGRDLYSFVPKFNHFRQRIEKNWNYCITYPSSSTTEGFDDIIERNGGINSLKVIYFDETRRSDNGTKMVVMYSKAKHGLAQGDYVNIYKTYDTNLYWVERNRVQVSDKYETQTEANDAMVMLNAEEPGEYSTASTTSPVTVTHKILDNAEVENVVDDYIFTVFNQGVEISDEWVLTSEIDTESFTIDVTTRRYFMDSDFNKYYIVNYEADGGYVNIDPNAQRISYKKVVNDIECEYYVRIFSRLPNFKYSSGDTSNEYEIYRQRSNEDKRNLVEIYQSPEYDFESHVSRLAFAKNIYTDEVGEIVFTDDIDLSYLKDNLGRPLSEIFLTIVKNNKGYKEWYGFDGVTVDINSENVEYSHCFGKVTCGLKMSDESIYDQEAVNIKTINNIGCQFPGYNIEAINPDRNVPNAAQEEIVFDSDVNYYGDLCYYDNYNVIERSIQPILHRFNTAQRESINSSNRLGFSAFTYDEIDRDDYDTDDFRVMTYTKTNCNNKKEGYYYMPHYQIPIRSYDVAQTVLPDFLTVRSLINNGDSTTITTLQNHHLSPGDKSEIYDTVNNAYYNCVTVSGRNDSSKVYTCKIYDELGNPTTDIDGDRISDYRVFKLDNLDVPSYARILKDGTCRIIWRDLLNNGFNKADDTIEEYPFANGAFYINRRIDLYLRRQDPQNKYGLYADDDIEGDMPPIEDENNYIKEEDIEC